MYILRYIMYANMAQILYVINMYFAKMRKDLLRIPADSLW